MCMEEFRWESRNDSLWWYQGEHLYGCFITHVFDVFGKRKIIYLDIFSMLEI